MFLFVDPFQHLPTGSDEAGVGGEGHGLNGGEKGGGEVDAREFV